MLIARYAHLLLPSGPIFPAGAATLLTLYSSSFIDADIYDESAKLLYEEIDYTLEGKNAARFKQSFTDIGINYIRVPDVYWEVTNERVLTMEYSAWTLLCIDPPAASLVKLHCMLPCVLPCVLPCLLPCRCSPMMWPDAFHRSRRH